MLVDSFLENTAEKTPEKTALVSGPTRLCYAELDAQSNRLAQSLIAQDVRQGDRVAIYLGNTLEAVVSLWAVIKAGAVFVMINPTAKAEKLAYLLDNSRAAALILPARRKAALAPVLDAARHLRTIILTGRAVGGDSVIDEQQPPSDRRHSRLPHNHLPQKIVSLDELLAEQPHDVAPPPPKRHTETDLAGLLYTSGSSGIAKGVMATHRNIVSASLSIVSYLESTADDVILNVLPVSFGYGLYQAFMAANVGATLVLEPSFAYPHAVLAKLIDQRATGFPMVPTMVSMLLDMDLAKYNLSCLRYITTAGAALPPEHAQRLRGLLPRTKLYAMYGLTECARVSYLEPSELDRRPTSVGRGMPNQQTAIVDSQGRRVAPGVVGELVVRGPHVMQGYWDLPEATRKVLRRGPFGDEAVLFTGDLFRADEDGYLYFVGRKDNMIKSRGEKVSPKEIEDVLYRHAAVAEAAVVGVADRLLGEAIHAYVVLRPGAAATERELLRHCAERLEDFMVPQVVRLRDTLPKSDNGKILKRELQETLR